MIAADEVFVTQDAVDCLNVTAKHLLHIALVEFAQALVVETGLYLKNFNKGQWWGLKKYLSLEDGSGNRTKERRKRAADDAAMKEFRGVFVLS